MMKKDYPSHHDSEEDSDSSDESEEDEDSDSDSSDHESKEDSSSSSDDESEEGNNGEQENSKEAAAVIKKRKSVIKKPEAVIKKRKSVIKKPEAAIKKQSKPRKKVEVDDRDESLQLLLERLNNGAREIPPPDQIVSKIPNAVAVEFSRCIYKQLSESDVDVCQTRLTLGKKQVKDHFLCGLEECEIPGKEGVDVLVYGPDGESHKMKFKTLIGNRNLPVFIKGWSKFVKAYELQKYSDVLKIWMFRSSPDLKICFAIHFTRFVDITKPLSTRILNKVFKNSLDQESKDSDSSGDESEEDSDSSNDESEEGNNGEQENSKEAAAVIKKRKSFIKKPKAAIKKQPKPRKSVEVDDREESLQLLLERLNNGEREIPPPDQIVSKIPNAIAVEFSRCIYKQLSENDVNVCQNRLTLGNKQVKDHFLCRLEESEIPGKEGVDVLVYGPDGKVHEMKFKKLIRNSPMLTNGWIKFVEAYGLRKYSDVLQIWMFRGSEDRKNCFAIHFTRFVEITKQLSTRILKKIFKNSFDQESKDSDSDSDSNSNSDSDSDSNSDSDSDSSDDESEEGNNGEQENSKEAAAVIKKRKSLINKPEAAIKKQPKLRNMVEVDDREESLKLLLQELNNGELEIPPPDQIVLKIPNAIAVEFSRCIYKQLSESDVKFRLMLGKQEVKDNCLCLVEESENILNGVDVLVYGPDGKSHEMKFKMYGERTHVLANGWGKFVKAYMLQEYSDVLQIWMFRSTPDHKICFAIHFTRFDHITKRLSKRILNKVFKY